MEKQSTRSMLTKRSSETVSTVGSHTKEAVISVVLMERDVPSVINFIILLVCVSLGKVESNLQISVKNNQITVTLTMQCS